MLYSETLIRVHVKINPKPSVLNMNCPYVTVVDCLKVAPRKQENTIKHKYFLLYILSLKCSKILILI